MKSIILMLGISLIFLNDSLSQTILPASRSFKVQKGKLITDMRTKRNVNKDSVQRANTILSAKIFSTQNSEDKNSENSIRKISDSIYNAQKEEANRLEREELFGIVSKLNETSPVSPIVTAGISNLENTKQAYGNISVGLQFRLSKYNLTKKNWIDPHYLYLIFSAKTATSPDSSSIQKTFMFPELNRRDFVLGYYWQFQKNDWTLAPSFEFSLNRFTDTANEKSFVSQSFTAGLRIQKSLKFDDLNTFISIYPYYSLLTVDRKYAVDYQELIGEPKIPSTFHSFGMHISAQFPNAILFCNMKYILNNGNDLKSRELKRFVYTIGTMLNLD